LRLEPIRRFRGDQLLTALVEEALSGDPDRIPSSNPFAPARLPGAVSQLLDHVRPLKELKLLLLPLNSPALFNRSIG
jgi:hypothetical protein